MGLKKAISVPSETKLKLIKDLLKIIFYGPGYNFKKPEFRLGDPKDLPKASYNLFDPPTMILSSSYMIVQLLR